MHHYGWRAYALPVLVAITVIAVVRLASPGPASPGSDLAGSGPVSSPAEQPQQQSAQPPVTELTTVQVTVTPSSQPTTVTVKQPPVTTTVDNQLTTISPPPIITAIDPNGTFGNLPAGQLPPGMDFAKTGEGTWHVVPGTSPAVGVGTKHVTYTVDVEDGIENASDDQAFAASVVATLSDSRSWVGSGDITMQRIDKGTPDFRVSLTSQMTVRQPQNCGWDVPLEASCYNQADGRVFINDARWARGAVSFNGDLGSYRVYAINHEVGHALGNHHEPCGQNGGLAPVMMQQSWSTSDDDLNLIDPQGPVPADDKVCKYNPFPYPRGGPAAAAIAAASAAGTGENGKATTTSGAAKSTTGG